MVYSEALIGRLPIVQLFRRFTHRAALFIIEFLADAASP